MVIPESFFIGISIFIVVIYLLMIYLGYKRGLLYELVSLLYTALALFIAWFAAPVLASLFQLFDISKVSDKYALLNKVLNLNSLLNTAAYFLIIFLIMRLLYLFISLLVKGFNKIPVIGGINRIFGALLGVVNGTLIVLALSMLLSTPLIKNGKAIKENTLLKYVSYYSDQAFEYIVEKIYDSNAEFDGEGIDIDSYRQEFKEWLISIKEKDD